ncbi:hypothetical protein EFK50_05845 [Nocardioides marmoriginsengisoli]|uniref:Glycosyltransferase RgtA/B/C/D-like domain-containing protein n=1 Tax=Nocardioides marmoriginsengisoli TaxID=661483 RepID=A0A3N0CKV0_9ACTN|nr:hypothetical protein [Nocardioides marmoriginsengisoli]RNL64070.1 hypothetical protein EFK50_05845 [Nocardioides marmoriginsengisoli]
MRTEHRNTSAPTRWGRVLPWALGLLAALVLTEAWRQVGHPYIAHDDWGFLLPVDAARRDAMLDHVLAEGRWLNYLWWLGPGHLLTPVTAVLLFGTAYLTFVAGVARRWAPGWLGLPVALALFSSPMIADLWLWPATLGPSMLITAVAALTVSRCARRPQLLRAWVVLATFLAFLSYPPAALVILVIVVVELVDRSLRELTGITVVFGLAYVASALVVFTLNQIAFGTFGIEPMAWRRPNPLHDLGDVGQNLRTYADSVGELVGSTTIPIALGALGVAVCLALPRLRARGLRLVLLVVALLGVQAATTIASGTFTPYRSNAWLWLLVVVPFVWIARETSARQWGRAAAVVALVVVGSWGIRYWQAAVEYSQDRREHYQRIEDRVVAEARKAPYDAIYLLGSEEDWRRGLFRQETQYLSEKTRADHGITLLGCHPPSCRLGSRPSVVARIAAGRHVMRTGDYIVVVPSAARHR